jgi:hypothetical protein
MGIQPRRAPAPKVEPKVEQATVTPEVEAESVTQCRTYNDDGERCTKPLGHVGDGDPDHAYE